MATEQELHQGLFDAVVDMDEEQSAELASEVVRPAMMPTLR